eukprot:8228403-Alexandrium_andersonii.AAC.1
MSNFFHGHSSLQMSLEVKFSCFNSLPLKLLGCAHDDRVVAQECAQACMFSYETMCQDLGLPPEDRSHPERHGLHPAVVMAFSEQKLGGAFSSFAVSGGLCPQLELYLAQMRFVPMLELAVEAKHALAKSRVRLRKRATADMFNFELLIGEAKDWFKTHPDNFQQFV